jgi:maleylpyruvate isomerase
MITNRPRRGTASEAMPRTRCNDGGVPTIAELLTDLDDATAALLRDLDGLTDHDAREKSLLPGWSRGHVLTHLARNAEGGTRLLIWARTGEPGYEYPSVAARAQAIEDGAGRPAQELAEDVQRTATALQQAAAAMPPDAWQHRVTWTTGQETGAGHVPASRLAEVLIHHVDLNHGYRPADWPAGWTAWMLDRAVQGMNDERHLAPLNAGLYATDTGREFRLDRPGGTEDAERISGTEADLLAWLMGRSDGAALTRDKPGQLPAPPSIYHT